MNQTETDFVECFLAGHSNNMMVLQLQNEEIIIYLIYKW